MFEWRQFKGRRGRRANEQGKVRRVTRVGSHFARSFVAARTVIRGYGLLKSLCRKRGKKSKADQGHIYATSRSGGYSSQAWIAGLGGLKTAYKEQSQVR